MKKKEFLTALPHVEPLSVDLGDFGLESEELEGTLGTGIGIDSSHRLFGFLTRERIFHDLAQSGVEQELVDRGYGNFELDIDRLNSYEESLRLWGQHPQGRDYLVDLRAHWGMMSYQSEGARYAKALVWDWVELRDPFAVFDRPPLPGQSKPGLRLFQRFVKMMRDYVHETDAECLVAVPQYFHNAVFYSRSPDFPFEFLDPIRQGELLALQSGLLQGCSEALSRVSWAFERGEVEMQSRDGTWEPYGWKPAELVLPLESEFREYFHLGSRAEVVARHSTKVFRCASQTETGLL